MKIVTAKLWSYRLVLSRPLPTTAEPVHHRDGLILELQSDNGLVGLGDMAPLPGYSTETLSEAQTEAEAVLWHLKGSEIPPNLEELSGGFEAWLGKIARLPSVRFGVESATVNLLAASNGITPAALISRPHSRSVTVNGVLSGSSDEVIVKTEELVAKGYRAFKLKVGRLGLQEEIELVRKVRVTVGDDATLRLDANGRFTNDDATRFGHGIADCSIKYIEEPVSNLSEMKRLLSSETYPLPVALDESLVSIEPCDLADWDRVHAVVIKPTRLGLERAMMFARFATSRSIKVVVTSTFESGVGIIMLINLAAGLNRRDLAVGLDTLDWFESDLLASPLVFESARIDLDDLLPAINMSSLNGDLLAEVNRA